MPPIERALLATVPWLLGGLVAAVPLLIVDVDENRIAWFVVQLGVLVAFGIALTFRLLPFADRQWFVETGWSRGLRLGASGASIVVLVTGTVGLVTMASSAAIGFDPSAQYLQLLSALDVAWVTGAVIIGLWRAWGRPAAIVGGLAIGAICVWSIWNYLNIVGLGPSGEWVVSGDELLRLVIPFDVMAATIAIGLFVYGTAVAGRETEHVSPQS